MPQAFELQAKKLPKQARSKATFDALIEACTLVLQSHGYAGTTTNHIADTAGVGIASLYEYFPGKDAIVAKVIERMNERVLTNLAKRAFNLRELPKEELMQAWLEQIYRCLLEEQPLLRVISYEVPYSEQVLNSHEMPQRLLQFSELLEYGAMEVLPQKQSKESMYLIVNLVVSSLTQLVVNPPPGLDAQAVIEELSKKMNQWVFGP